MSKRLVIAEKPSVARDMAKALGGFHDEEEYLESEDYLITWAVGHLVEFIPPDEIDPKYKFWMLEDLPIIPDKFELKAKDKCTSRIRAIKKLMNRKDVDYLVNACDAGREGELIFRELVKFCKSKKPILRLWLQSMTPEAIRHGFDDLRPGEEYENLYQAAQCRSEADWLIGMNATRALTRRLKHRQEKNSWSAGRVQTPTLAMLQSRELEILQFRSRPFWRLKAQFDLPQESDDPTPPHQYEGTYFDPKCDKAGDAPKRDEWILDEVEAKRIMETVKGQVGLVSETRTPKSIAAPRLFDLTTLQREANRRFGMSAKNTLAAAQRLYESHKLITYPRTSSKCLPSDYVGTVKQLFSLFTTYKGRASEGFLNFDLYAQSAEQLLKSDKLLNFGKIFDDKGITDHFAIIPTSQRLSKSLRDDEARIYNLIVRRFLAAFFPQAIQVDIDRETVVETPSHEQFHFRTRASYLSEKGWKAVYGQEGKEENDVLPKLINVGGRPSAAKVSEVSLKDETTTPPARITEARLLSLMENAGKQVEDEDLSSAIKDTGLGTPATRAEIIEALLARGYIERADKALKTTTKGIILIDILKRIDCKRLASPELTGQMEYNLNQVEHGTYKGRKYMDEIIDYTKDIVDKTKAFEYEQIYADDEPLGLCPICHKHQVYERMRFYACEANHGRADDACSFIVWKENNGRYLDTRTMRELLADGETELLEGFKGSGNRTYRARLRWQDGSLNLETENGDTVGASDIELPVSNDILGLCPFDRNCHVVETSTDYHCEQTCVLNGSHKKGFSMSRIVCQRTISHEELQTLLTNGRTELLEGFISKFNKPFKGYLVLSEQTGRYKFEFAPRAGRAAKEAAPADTDAPATPKRTRKKTATETQSEAVAPAAPARPKRTRKKAAEAKAGAVDSELTPPWESAEPAATVAPARPKRTRKKATAEVQPEAVVPGEASSLWEDIEATKPVAPARPKRTRKKAVETQSEVVMPGEGSSLWEDMEPAKPAAPARPKRTRKKAVETQSEVVAPGEGSSLWEDMEPAKPATPTRPKRTRKKAADT